MAPLWLQDMSWPEVQDRLTRTQCILIPVGSTEQHGPHLPLGVDTFVPIHACEEIARRSGIPIAPPVWFGTCEWHMGFAGTISLRPSTVIALFADIFGSLVRHGFRNLIIINGHGGGYNPALTSAADEFQIGAPEARVWIADVFGMARDTVLNVCESDLLYHADEIETSQMLVARADLVHLDKAEVSIPSAKVSRFVSYNLRGGLDEIINRPTAAAWKELSPTGQVGDPTVASREKGSAMLEALVANVVTLIGDLELRQHP